MNYFELFDIPLSLQINREDLSKKYYALCKDFHPDTLGANNEEALFDAIEKTAQINLAYKTLQSLEKRIAYILELHGLLENNPSEKLPQDFLMEMLELNENIMQAKMEDDMAAIEETRKILFDKKNTLQASIISLQTENFNPTDNALQRLKEYYFQWKYLMRIEEQLNKN